MTFNTVLCAFSAALFIISALLFVSQAIYALNFRKKIALTHGFSEAIMPTFSYLLLIISFCLIFIQFISFIAFGFGDEQSTVLRFFAYLSSIILFLYFRHKTPPLLAYWLGKTCLWRKAGYAGKIPYSEIIGIRLSKSVKLPITDAQKLCRVTFFIRQGVSDCKSITCLVSACDLEMLSQQINVFPPSHKPDGAQVVRRSSALFFFMLAFTAYVTAFLLFASFGFFNRYRYQSDGSIITEEVKTVTSVTSVGECDGKIFVYYGKINIISVYDASGTFLYAISCPSSVFKPSAFSVTDGGIINYRSDDTLYRYSAADGSVISSAPLDENAEKLLRVTQSNVKSDYSSVYFTDPDGNETAVITGFSLLPLFNIEVIWCIAAILTAVTFTVKLFGIRKSAQFT